MGTMRYAVEAMDVVFCASMAVTPFVVAMGTMQAASPSQPVVEAQQTDSAQQAESDEDAYCAALAEKYGYGPGLERFDGMSAHWGWD